MWPNGKALDYELVHQEIPGSTPGMVIFCSLCMLNSKAFGLNLSEMRAARCFCYMGHNF